MSLGDVMEFDHPIRVTDDGTVNDVHGVYAPDTWIEADKDGQVSRASEHEMIADVYRQGWEPLFGYTAQYGSAGSPIMHSSEFIGGRMEEDILSTPGIYVAVVVEVFDSGDACGWMVLRKGEDQ